jgi:short-subunit dehydrogenase
MSSVWGRVTSPEVSAYVTSKFAVRAFSECLRQELADAPGIGIALVLPQVVDTPIFDNAGTYSGRRPRPIPPLVAPEEVAQGIVRCAESPADEITYGRLGRVGACHSRLVKNRSPGAQNIRGRRGISSKAVLDPANRSAAAISQIR